MRELLPHIFTLTHLSKTQIGGLVSVTLSILHNKMKLQLLVGVILYVVQTFLLLLQKGDRVYTNANIGEKSMKRPLVL